MASIKEIAKLAGVSLGTTSFVLNGKGDQMRISQATQQKIFDVARELGYRPNISARRLGGGKRDVPVIAILWALDTRSYLIGRFLEGIQKNLVAKNREFELLVQPYENSKINQVESLMSGTQFNGAIIANASDRDLEFLESQEINVPIVLYVRDSSKYSNVNVDNFETGKKVAELFKSRGHQRVDMVVPNISSQAIRLRKDGFISGAQTHGLELSPGGLLYDEVSEEGGYNAAKQIIEQGNIPTAMFFPIDTMAVGALAAFHEAGIRIPEDLEIIGHDNYDHTRFSIPPLSTVHLPVEEIAVTCVNTLLDLIERKVEAPVSISFETSFVFRKSCGGFPTSNSTDNQ
ncbi:LacI family DNA-binding transcriptional regulator [Bacillus sp. MRMR6]|uniref:LacI family DNA-binding transcriptional regulator n=1 Tax=Bacillus sp. MRMR6 TaxID=1928617 RepID=UPI0009523BC8|nr:LacI family DNA-binding transcriptional regulator [Bacillus sp. MRMR6]OLS33580.1 LacI family transcriptional regulator [Bacillus sp. MRMR6]